MNLYEINSAILECVDMETGEIIDFEKLESLQEERDVKIENISCWIKNLSSDAEQLKQEADKLMQRKKVAENKAESLKKYLFGFLDGEKFKTAKVSISYRSSESVDVEDTNLIPKEFLRYKDPEPDKTLIKAALKAGHELPGAQIVKKQSIVIK